MLDWSPSGDILKWLATGAGVTALRLRCMTIPVLVPGSEPTWFARWALPPFPGCHAFCPACATEDVERFGGLVQRVRDAGLGQIACIVHRCILDGVDNEEQIGPRRAQARPASWLGDVRREHAREPAPEFTVVFQRAFSCALTGEGVGPLWLAPEPAEFLRACRGVILWLMTGVWGAGVTRAPLSRLLWWWAGRAAMPSMYEDELWFDRMAVRMRVQALAATGLLMLRPDASAKLRSELWNFNGAQREHDRALMMALEPWQIAVLDTDEHDLARLRANAAAWSADLRETVERACAWRSTRVGRPMISWIN